MYLSFLSYRPCRADVDTKALLRLVQEHHNRRRWWRLVPSPLSGALQVDPDGGSEGVLPHLARREDLLQHRFMEAKCAEDPGWC
jgi:hypothetical protein